MADWIPLNHQELKRQLIEHEGRRNKPYRDSLGVWTVGVGHNIQTPLDEVAIDCLLANDIRIAERMLDDNVKGWRDIGDVRMRVVADMAFNLGPRLLEFHEFLRALTKHDFTAAAAAMRDSLWYRQVGLRGTRLAKMMLNGEVTP